MNCCRVAQVAALLLLLLGVGSRNVMAQPLDLSQGGPITVTAVGGIEWRQNDKEVIAHGDARAVRGAVTVTADVLIAHYRPKPPQAASTSQAGSSSPAPLQTASAPASTPGSLDTGGQEIYRLNAEGHVHIFTATDQAFGDHAVYDLDQSVLVLTGQHLKLTTPNDVLTARRDLEYWPDKHMAVARGDAVVTTNTGRRLTADTLVAYTAPPDNTPPSKVGPGNAAPNKVAAPQPANGATTDPLATSGRIKRVEAFGHVVVRTATETATGDRGVYIPATEIALLLGNVHITRGENQLNGERGVVDMKTGVADLLSTPGARVRGLVVPNSVNNTPPASPSGSSPQGTSPSSSGAAATPPSATPQPATPTRSH